MTMRYRSTIEHVCSNYEDGPIVECTDGITYRVTSASQSTSTLDDGTVRVAAHLSGRKVYKNGRETSGLFPVRRIKRTLPSRARETYVPVGAGR